jgi:septal ring factor EnvC (AmiA/AmiB activator)
MSAQSKETRTDRLEKNIELLFKGIVELKESQKLTDKQLRKTDEQILELKESQKKTDRQLNQTIKKLDEVGRQLGDLGLVQGEVAEDLFYRKEQAFLC